MDNQLITLTMTDVLHLIDGLTQSVSYKDMRLSTFNGGSTHDINFELNNPDNRILIRLECGYATAEFVQNPVGVYIYQNELARVATTGSFNIYALSGLQHFMEDLMEQIQLANDEDLQPELSPLETAIKAFGLDQEPSESIDQFDLMFDGEPGVEDDEFDDLLVFGPLDFDDEEPLFSLPQFSAEDAKRLREVLLGPIPEADEDEDLRNAFDEADELDAAEEQRDDAIAQITVQMGLMLAELLELFPLDAELEIDFEITVTGKNDDAEDEED